MERLALLGGAPVRLRLLPYGTVDRAGRPRGDDGSAGRQLDHQGPAVAHFERALADRAGVKHAVAVASGTAALHDACWAVGLGPGDEVITTPLTFAATATLSWVEAPSPCLPTSTQAR